MNSDDADTQTMLRLKGGDDLALNELMARWQQPLANYLLRFCGNEATALDLAQETFVRVYEARARYDARGKFTTWLYTIAGNLARNSHRWQQRHPSVSLDAPMDGGGDTGSTLGARVPDNAPAPDASAEQAERTAAVRAAIAELPGDLRTAVLLSEYEDRSHADIAAVLGCSTKAVEMKLYRARQTLRKRLASWLQN